MYDYIYNKWIVVNQLSFFNKHIVCNIKSVQHTRVSFIQSPLFIQICLRSSTHPNDYQLIIKILNLVSTRFCLPKIIYSYIFLTSDINITNCIFPRRILFIGIVLWSNKIGIDITKTKHVFMLFSRPQNITFYHKLGESILCTMF